MEDVYKVWLVIMWLISNQYSHFFIPRNSMTILLWNSSPLHQRFVIWLIIVKCWQNPYHSCLGLIWSLDMTCPSIGLPSPPTPPLPTSPYPTEGDKEICLWAGGCASWVWIPASALLGWIPCPSPWLFGADIQPCLWWECYKVLNGCVVWRCTLIASLCAVWNAWW